MFQWVSQTETNQPDQSKIKKRTSSNYYTHKIYSKACTMNEDKIFRYNKNRCKTKTEQRTLSDWDMILSKPWRRWNWDESSSFEQEYNRINEIKSRKLIWVVAIFGHYIIILILFDVLHYRNVNVLVDLFPFCPQNFRCTCQCITSKINAKRSNTLYAHVECTLKLRKYSMMKMLYSQYAPKICFT